MATATKTAQPRELAVERAAGVRATFVVYYLRGGKKYLDGMFSATEGDAREDFLAAAREIGWKVEIQRVEVRA